jgi:hypothetical protein
MLWVTGTLSRRRAAVKTAGVVATVGVAAAGCGAKDECVGEDRRADGDRGGGCCSFCSFPRLRCIT